MRAKSGTISALGALVLLLACLGFVAADQPVSGQTVVASQTSWPGISLPHRGIHMLTPKEAIDLYLKS